MRSTLHLPACEAYKLVPLSDPIPVQEPQQEAVVEPAARPEQVPTPIVRAPEIVVAGRLTGHSVA
jgi:hypothetical protein